MSAWSHAYVWLRVGALVGVFGVARRRRPCIIGFVRIVRHQLSMTVEAKEHGHGRTELCTALSMVLTCVGRPSGRHPS